EALADAGVGDAFDVIPVVLRRVDVLVDKGVLVRLVGGAGAGDRLGRQPDERPLFGFAAIDVVAEVFDLGRGRPADRVLDVDGRLHGLGILGEHGAGRVADQVRRSGIPGGRGRRRSGAAFGCGGGGRRLGL